MSVHLRTECDARSSTTEYRMLQEAGTQIPELATVVHTITVMTKAAMFETEQRETYRGRPISLCTHRTEGIRWRL